jgi:hypothetical protein
MGEHTSGRVSTTLIAVAAAVSSVLPLAYFFAK